MGSTGKARQSTYDLRRFTERASLTDKPLHLITKASIVEGESSPVLRL